MTASKELKTLFIVPRYWPNLGGAERHTRELVHRMRHANAVDVVRHCGDNKDNVDQSFARNDALVIDDNGIGIHQLVAEGLCRPVLKLLAPLQPHVRAVRPLYAALARHSLRRQLRRMAPQYQLIHYVYNGFTASAEVAAEVAEELGIPFVLTPLAHTTREPGTAWSSEQFRQLYQRADMLIAMTEYERDWLIRQGAHPNRVKVCPVAPLLDGHADADEFRSRHQLRDHPVVLFLGRLVDAKGFRELARAAPRIWAHHPHARILFAGPCDQRARAFLDGIDDPRLINLGTLENREKDSALAACDLLCVPSVEESLGVIYLEAWHYGKPVVAADIPVLRTILRNGIDGLLVRPRPDDVADQIIRLLDNPGLRERMGSAGRNRVENEYNWDDLVARLLDIYRGLLAASNRAGFAG